MPCVRWWVCTVCVLWSGLLAKPYLVRLTKQIKSGREQVFILLHFLCPSLPLLLLQCRAVLLVMTAGNERKNDRVRAWFELACEKSTAKNPACKRFKGSPYLSNRPELTLSRWGKRGGGDKVTGLVHRCFAGTDRRLPGRGSSVWNAVRRAGASGNVYFDLKDLIWQSVWGIVTGNSSLF